MNPDDMVGGMFENEPSDPPLGDVKKIGVVVVDVPNARDPSQTQLMTAPNFEAGLECLGIDCLIEVTDIEGLSHQVTLKIRKSKDLVESGIVKQIPMLKQMADQSLFLHKIHEQFTNSMRVQNEFNNLDSKYREELVSLFETLADEFQNKL